MERVLRETAGERVIWVRGAFDPMLAAHARRVAEMKPAGGILVALLAEPERPLMAARARAELAASLEAVDYVVENGAAVEGVEVVEVEDAAWTAEFEDRVRRRCGGGRN